MSRDSKFTCKSQVFHYVVIWSQVNAKNKKLGEFESWITTLRHSLHQASSIGVLCSLAFAVFTSSLISLSKLPTTRM